MPPAATTARARQGTKRKSDDAPYAVSGLKRGGIGVGPSNNLNGTSSQAEGPDMGVISGGQRTKRRKIDHPSVINGNYGPSGQYYGQNNGQSGVRKVPLPNDEGVLITVHTISKLLSKSL